MLRGPSHWITGASVVLLARIGLTVFGCAASALYYADLATAPLVAVMAYALAILSLLSLPALRSADIFALGAVALTLSEFAAAALLHYPIDSVRWLHGMAALGAAVLPIRALRLRALAIAHPYRTLSSGERRGARAASGARPVAHAQYAARAAALPLMLPAPTPLTPP